MKKLMFISILIAGVSAFAAPEKTLHEVCSGVVNEATCFDAGAENHLNNESLGISSEINFSRRNRSFKRNLRRDIINALRAYRYNNIHKMGRVMNKISNKLYSRNGHNRVKDLLEKAIIAYNNRNYDRAARLLKAMRKRLF